LLATLWLMSKGKNYLWTLIPFVFMFITTIAALFLTGYMVLSQVVMTPDLPTDKVIGNIVAGGIAIFLIIAALILAWDSLKAFQRLRAGAPVQA
jgi:carbon starvation protein CstA